MEQIIPAILYTYLVEFSSHFTKPGFMYFGAYIVGLLISRGRKTVSRIAHTCFFVERHLSSWERFLAEYRWDPKDLVTTLLGMLRSKWGAALMVHGAYLVAVDTLLIAKNGDKMLGIQQWKDHSGNADRGETMRGHHWGILGLIGFSARWGRYLCFPLLMQLVPGQLNPFQFVVDPAGVVTIATFWDAILPLIYQLAPLLGDVPLRVVADAYFAKAPFIQALLDKDIHLISRLRKDAVGWDDPSSDQRKDAKRGRKWKLATLLDHFPAIPISVNIYGKLVVVHAVCRELWLRDVGQKVKVVVIEGIKKPIILLSTDCSLSMTQIIETYAARFTLEVAIRDLKQHFGLADYQCYLTTAIHRFVHLACFTLSLFRLIQLTADIADWLPDGRFAPLSFNRLRLGLQRFIIRRILSPNFGQFPKSQACPTELDAILRIVA